MLEDPCGGDCECERLLRGSADDIDVPVVLDQDAAGRVVLTRAGQDHGPAQPTATGPVEVPVPKFKTLNNQIPGLIRHCSPIRNGDWKGGRANGTTTLYGHVHGWKDGPDPRH